MFKESVSQPLTTSPSTFSTPFCRNLCSPPSVHVAVLSNQSHFLLSLRLLLLQSSNCLLLSSTAYACEVFSPAPFQATRLLPHLPLPTHLFCAQSSWFEAFFATPASQMLLLLFILPPSSMSRFLDHIWASSIPVLALMAPSSFCQYHSPSTPKSTGLIWLSPNGYCSAAHCHHLLSRSKPSISNSQPLKFHTARSSMVLPLIASVHPYHPNRISVEFPDQGWALRPCQMLCTT